MVVLDHKHHDNMHFVDTFHDGNAACTRTKSQGSVRSICLNYKILIFNFCRQAKYNKYSFEFNANQL